MTVDLVAIRQRLACVPDGPWAPCEKQPDAIVRPGGRPLTMSSSYIEHYGGEFICESVSGDVKEFILHARDDIEALLDEIERAHRELDEHDRFAPPRSKVPVLANRIDQAIDRLFIVVAERDGRLAAIRELVQS